MIQKIQNPDSTLYIAVGIDKEFSSLETEALYNLVSDGGNIIIASDLASTVNPLASKFGVSFSEHSIIYKFEEIDYNYTFLPVIASTQNNSFSIIVHSPLGLVIPSEDTRILAQSKGNGQIISALDKNDNIKIDGADKPGPIPIIVEVTVNSGKAVFISDAGMFSDNLWKLESLDPDFAGMIYQNEEFIVDLVSSMYTPDGKLIYDTSKQKEGFSNFHPYPEE
jgi:hypothetical protein